MEPYWLKSILTDLSTEAALPLNPNLRFLMPDTAEAVGLTHHRENLCWRTTVGTLQVNRSKPYQHIFQKAWAFWRV